MDFNSVKWIKYRSLMVHLIENFIFYNFILKINNKKMAYYIDYRYKNRLKPVFFLENRPKGYPLWAFFEKK